VLWDPVASGAAYLEELVGRAPHSASHSRLEADEAGSREIMGFPVTGTLAGELAELDVARLALPEKTLVVWSSTELWLAHRIEAGKAVAPKIDVVETMPAWLDTWPNVGVLPVAATRRIASWLA